MSGDKDFIISGFPGLTHDSFEITSPMDNRYNCIAWAAGDDSNWWWPSRGHHWPSENVSLTLTAFTNAFEELGYTECESTDFEPDFAKVAIFANAEGIPKHAARMLPNGRWTSKLGKYVDIEHDLSGIEGTAYGRVACVLRRPVEPPFP